jgi:uncharacterized protein YjbK
MKSNPKEVETALVICSAQPRKTVEQVAGLTAIGNYRLLPRSPRMIRDRYFDTPAQDLQSLALRLREVDGPYWLTLKGDSQPTDWGGVRRLEIEVGWSREGLTMIINELKDRGVNLRSLRKVDYARPLEVLKRLGLKIIQDRENLRIIRDIVRKDDKKGEVLAELAIDSVVYHFSKQNIRFYEVEIESKSKAGAVVVNAVAKSLSVQFGSFLRLWNYGKLTTGKAIEKMLGQGLLKGLLTTDNRLKQSAYDKIARYLIASYLIASYLIVSYKLANNLSTGNI